MSNNNQLFITLFKVLISAITINYLSVLLILKVTTELIKTLSAVNFEIKSSRFSFRFS